MTDRILGVLGGMGPLASAHFMVRLTLLTPATCDQEHIPTILWSDPRVPDRTAGSLDRGVDPLPALVRGLSGLQQAGAGAIAIPCNTAHAWYDRMHAAVDLPILHIVDAAIAELERLEIPKGPVGVLGTATTLRMRLYHDRLERLGWPCLSPGETEMAGLVTPAIDLVKANRVTEAYPQLAEAVLGLAQRGAQAIILGCTEIPLGIMAGPYQQLGVPLVDTIDGLARAAIAWARRSEAATIVAP